MHKKLLEALRKHHIVYRPEPFAQLAGRIIEHAMLIRKEGVLAVEKMIEDEKNYLYRKLMGMVLDGIDRCTVDEAAEIFIENVSAYLQGHQKSIKVPEPEIEFMLRQMRMVARGVKMIQEKQPPYLIEEVLFFYILGEARPASRFKKSSGATV